MNHKMQLVTMGKEVLVFIFVVSCSFSVRDLAGHRRALPALHFEGSS